MAVKIVVDSASDISKKEAESLGIEMIPMLINFGEEEFYDGVDLTPDEFYEKLIENDILPKTSLINAYRFEELFTKHIDKGDDIVVITISSKLSGTFNAAKEAADKFKGRVFAVDSLSACAGERLLVEYALRLVKDGATAMDVAEELNFIKNKVQIMAMVNTLEYLKKGGRISAAAAIAGKILSIKPVVGIVDGEVKVLGKAMGSKNGSNLLNKIVNEKGIDFSMPYCVLYSGLEKATLDKYVKDSSAVWEDETDSIPEFVLGATIGTHVGPGAVGVAFFAK